jgi:hypothetical protein
MTATITPDVATITAMSPHYVELGRTDPAVRLADYTQALDFYIGELNRGAIASIVFVENSASDVSSLVALAAARRVGDRVEFIANYGEHSYPERDRSYGETRLLDHAMATSRLIAAAGNRAVVWKITGRNRPIAWLDLRFMAWTRAGYDRLLRGIAERLGTDPKEPAMHAYVTALADPMVVQRYRREPLVDGVRGWDNRPYGQGRAKLKFWVRATTRRVLPFLWI